MSRDDQNQRKKVYQKPVSYVTLLAKYQPFYGNSITLFSKLYVAIFNFSTQFVDWNSIARYDLDHGLPQKQRGI